MSSFRVLLCLFFEAGRPGTDSIPRKGPVNMRQGPLLPEEEELPNTVSQAGWALKTGSSPAGGAALPVGLQTGRVRRGLGTAHRGRVCSSASLGSSWYGFRRPPARRSVAQAWLTGRTPHESPQESGGLAALPLPAPV